MEAFDELMLLGIAREVAEIGVHRNGGPTIPKGLPLQTIP